MHRVFSLTSLCESKYTNVFELYEPHSRDFIVMVHYTEISQFCLATVTAQRATHWVLHCYFSPKDVHRDSHNNVSYNHVSYITQNALWTSASFPVLTFSDGPHSSKFQACCTVKHTHANTQPKKSTISAPVRLLKVPGLLHCQITTGWLPVPTGLRI